MSCENKGKEGAGERDYVNCLEYGKQCIHKAGKRERHQTIEKAHTEERSTHKGLRKYTQRYEVLTKYTLGKYTQSFKPFTIYMCIIRCVELLQHNPSPLVTPALLLRTLCQFRLLDTRRAPRTSTCVSLTNLPLPWKTCAPAATVAAWPSTGAMPDHGEVGYLRCGGRVKDRARAGV
eukprot:5361826-Pleurochrysis_carterae.AAC.1